jgi:hypothetical protein
MEMTQDEAGINLSDESDGYPYCLRKADEGDDD